MPGSIRHRTHDDRALTAALERWFDLRGRDLPWRRRRSGYTALVAEAMLQQTQVSRVIEPYRRFVRAFPTVKALAASDEQAVLAAWQGLGYYRRARHLHAAAQMIARELAGRVPETAAGLRQLPGVGRYTAGAIASIVFGQREPIVDGNVQRVLARLHARRHEIGSRPLLDWSWRRSAELVAHARRPGVFNEALMELGATICTPRAPRCDSCPVAACCRARQRGIEHRIPAARQAAVRPQEHHHAVIIKRGAKLLMERRATDGRWGGLWQVPTIESGRTLAPAEIRRRLPVAVGALRKRGVFEHHLTHRRITFHVFAARSRGRRGEWRMPDDAGELPMSSAQRKVLALTDA